MRISIARSFGLSLLSLRTRTFILSMRKTADPLRAMLRRKRVGRPRLGSCRTAGKEALAELEPPTGQAIAFEPEEFRVIRGNITGTIKANAELERRIHAMVREDLQ
jgi:hypothetical protein